eukprot:10111.XXX_82184_82964_1 [CDS] Oithona nana genome sequencing.
MGDIDNPNNMIIIPPLPGRQLRLRKRKKRRLIKTSLSQQWPLLFASLLQYVFDYNMASSKATGEWKEEEAACQRKRLLCEMNHRLS